MTFEYHLNLTDAAMKVIETFFAKELRDKYIYWIIKNIICYNIRYVSEKISS